MSQSIEKLKTQVAMCETEVASALARGNIIAHRIAIQTLFSVQVFLAIAELQAELAATKAHWEERWSRRWEP